MTKCKCDLQSQEITIQTLLSGGVCILPTDTVYGFSTLSDIKGDNVNYANKIQKIKGRLETKPFIHLIAEPSDIKKYTNQKLPQKLLRFWPGELTIIVHLKKNTNLVSPLETAAFRCPKDEWLRQIILKCKRPLYSTSVNLSGYPVLETIKDIKETFLDKVDLIIEDEDKKGVLPSTIISIDNDSNITLLRQGRIHI